MVILFALVISPIFLINVKDKETTDLQLHILTKGVQYHYRVDSYNDSGITEGIVISE